MASEVDQSIMNFTSGIRLYGPMTRESAELGYIAMFLHPISGVESMRRSDANTFYQRPLYMLTNEAAKKMHAGHFHLNERASLKHQAPSQTSLRSS